MVGDVLNNITNLKAAVVPPTVENDFFSDLAESGRRLIGRYLGKLWRLFSFRDADICRKFPRAPKILRDITALIIVQRSEIRFFGRILKTFVPMLYAPKLFPPFSELMTESILSVVTGDV